MAFGLRVWDEVDKRRDAMYTRESRATKTPTYLGTDTDRPTLAAGPHTMTLLPERQICPALVRPAVWLFGQGFLKAAMGPSSPRAFNTWQFGRPFCSDSGSWTDNHPCSLQGPRPIRGARVNMG